MKKTTKKTLVSVILAGSMGLIVSLLFDYFGIPKNIFSYIVVLIIFSVISYSTNK